MVETISSAVSATVMVGIVVMLVALARAFAARTRHPARVPVPVLAEEAQRRLREQSIHPD